MNNLAELTRSTRARLVLVALVVGVLLIGGAWTLRAQDGADVVARVNGEAITKDELFDMMYQYIGPQALDELILVRLVEQEAAARGVVVPARARAEEHECHYEKGGLRGALPHVASVRW